MYKEGKPDRLLASVPLLPCPPEYARVAAWGWDSYQEAWNWNIGFRLQLALAAAQDAAREADEPVLLSWEGEDIGYVAPSGAKSGKKWTLKTPDILFLFGSAKSDWQISVRYLSAGLWQVGLDRLMYQARQLLEKMGCTPRGENWDVHRVSRADYAMDFHCPGFTREMKHPGITRRLVCHAEAKIRTEGEFRIEDDLGFYTVGTSARLQTITIGKMPRLQLQIYDKTLEIVEASGKDWMRELWAQNLDGEIPDHDVWRLELRFGKEFLKNRNLRRPMEVEEALPKLIAEAIYSRRLTRPVKGDTNRRRWPMHPLWSEMVRRAGGASMVPIGRKTTMRRAEFIEQMGAQMAGNLRVMSVAQHGDLIPSEIPEIMKAAEERLKGDGSNRRKVAILQDRLSPFYDKAQ